ncbi:hypothetical protein JCM10213_008602 [Rhodosporidiobolus nylandii]
MDTPPSSQHPFHSHSYSHHVPPQPHEPEELPALADLDLSSLSERTPGYEGGGGTIKAQRQVHYGAVEVYGPLHTPSRAYPPPTLPLSPSSPTTDPEDDDDADPSSADSSFDSYFPLHQPSPFLSSHPYPHSHSHSQYPYHPRNPGDFPPEIIALITHHLFYSHHPYPSAYPNPDPYLHLLPPSTSLFFPLPARLAPPLDAQAKETLAAAALVDKMWNAEATRALWRRVSFGMPRAFESVLRTIEEYGGGRRVKRGLRSDLAAARSGSAGEGVGLGMGMGLGMELEPQLKSGGFGASGKGAYVERWRREGSEGFAVEKVLESPVEIEAANPLSSALLPPPVPLPSTFPSISSAPSNLPRLNPRDSPLLFTRSISFARFRTAGMKRSIRSGKEERFVTPERVLTLLRGTRYPKRKLQRPVVREEEDEKEGRYGGMGFTGFGGAGAYEDSGAETETESESESVLGPPPGEGQATFGGWGRRSRKKVAGQLCQVGFSEYMDSAITFPVLEEVLFRGGYLAEYEEPDVPDFLPPDFAGGGAASSASGSEIGTPYLGGGGGLGSSSHLSLGLSGGGAAGSMVLSPGEQPFHYRHLQSSHSRSRSRSRSRSPSTATSIAGDDYSTGGGAAEMSQQGSGNRTPVLEELTPEQEYPDSFGPRDVAEEDAEMGDGARTPIGRRLTFRRSRNADAIANGGGRRRRGSGQDFVLPQGLEDAASVDTGYQSADSDLYSGSEMGSGYEGAEEEERGRERYTRGSRAPSGMNTPMLPMGRGRSRFPQQNRGIAAGAALQRSSSLPAPFHPHLAHSAAGPTSPGAFGGGGGGVGGGGGGGGAQLFPSSSHAHLHPSHPLGSPHPAHTISRSRGRAQSISRASERSSSVPASVSGRWAPEPVPKRVVQVLEGSLGDQPVRALDLCGCVSRVFVAGLDEFVRTYKLGPPALKSEQQGEDEDMEDEEDDDPFAAGRRTPSMRSVRMGLAEERVLNRTFFPHLRRLGLASSLLPSHLLTAFVLSFPYLTHLDLASTLTSPLLLKGLALAGQQGIGGRPMRLKALSLARCRLITGPALLGLLCGDCPPLTTMAGLSDDEDESWGAGEVVSELTDLSLFGDGTYPCPLERPELRLVLSSSPAFRSGLLRTVDLSSTPMTDEFLLEQFPPQPNLIELGLASCRAISMQAVSTFLCTKAQAVEVLDLSNSCPSTVGQGISSRRRTTIGQPTISIMELHAVLLSQCASLESSSSNPEEAQLLLALRQTNLRVVELDEKSLELVQGGAGDWKPIPGKGRRGWYVDTATSSRLPPYDPSHPPYPRPRQLVHLSKDDPQRLALLKLVTQHSAVTFEVGWHSRKMEVLRGDGLIGGQHDGLFAFHAFA